MIRKIRLFLINILFGDMSYAKNIVFAPNKALVRPVDNYIKCCVFLEGVRVDGSSYNLTD